MTVGRALTVHLLASLALIALALKALSGEERSSPDGLRDAILWL